MLSKKLPNAEEINLPESSDLEVARMAARSLLKGFAQIPDEERVDVLTAQRSNKAALVRALREAMVPNLTMLGRENNHDKLLAIAESVVDPVLEALSEIYPAQHQ